MAKSSSKSQRSSAVKALSKSPSPPPEAISPKLVRGTKHHCGGEYVPGAKGGKCHYNGGGGICTKHQAICLGCKRAFMAHQGCFCAKRAVGSAATSTRPPLQAGSGNGNVVMKRKASRELTERESGKAVKADK